MKFLLLTVASANASISSLKLNTVIEAYGMTVAQDDDAAKPEGGDGDAKPKEALAWEG